MSASALTKRLLSLHYDRDEDEFFQCLVSILQEFISTRNPIFPRQDVIESLMKTVTHTTSPLLIKLTLATLTEFCSTSVTYDADFVKKELIHFKMVTVLCAVLSRQRLSKDIELSELCLSLIRKLSDILLPVESQLVLSHVLPLCISMCNVREQLLFELTPIVQQKLRKMMLNKGLVMRAYECNTGASKRKSELFSQLFGSRELQFNWYVGDVFDTGSDHDRNICIELVDQGLVWFSSDVNDTDANDTDANDNAADNYRDIIPSEILDGPHFLAHELDKISQINDIEQIMQDKSHTPLASAPSVADLVTVHGALTSPHRVTPGTVDIFYRAQVCGEVEGTSCRVVSIDYGQVKEVDQSQLYHPCQSLAHVLPSATLCSINGLIPSPLSIKLLTTSLSILHTLSLGNFTVSHCMVNHWSAVSVLIDLARVSPFQYIGTQAMLLLASVSQCGRVRADEVLKYDAISKTITLMRHFAERGWRKTMMSACNALSVMVADNVNARSHFEEGLGELVMLISRYQSDIDVTTSLLQPIRNHFGNLNVCQKLASFNLTKKISSATTPMVLSDNDTAAVETIIKPTNPASTPAPMNGHRGGLSGRWGGAKHRQINLLELAEQSAEGNVSTSMRAAREKYYVKDDKTDLITSNSCSTFESEEAMDSALVQNLLVGFLNSGVTGSLMYGVTSDGVIKGITITRSGRDRLRLGIDRICSDFNPPLTANVPSLHFIPVCLREGAEDPALRMFVPDTFIVEIAVNASVMITQVFKLKNDERLLMRVGTQTKEVCPQVLRELIISRIELNMQVGL